MAVNFLKNKVFTGLTYVYLYIGIDILGFPKYVEHSIEHYRYEKTHAFNKFKI